MTVAQASFALIEETKAHCLDADVRVRRSMCGLRHDRLFKGVGEHEVAFYLVVENPTFAQLRFSQYASVCASSLIFDVLFAILIVPFSAAAQLSPVGLIRLRTFLPDRLLLPILGHPEQNAHLAPFKGTLP